MAICLLRTLDHLTCTSTAIITPSEKHSFSTSRISKIEFLLPYCEGITRKCLFIRQKDGKAYSTFEYLYLILFDVQRIVWVTWGIINGNITMGF